MRTIINAHRAAILATGMATALVASGAFAQQQNPEAQAGQRLQQQMQQGESSQSSQQGQSAQGGQSSQQSQSAQGGQSSQQSQSGQMQGQSAQSGQMQAQTGEPQPVIIVETDDGYYLVRPRQGQGLTREFRATGPSDQRPQRAEVNLDEFGREMYLRGYQQGRMEARQALQAVLEQAAEASQDQQGQGQQSQSPNRPNQQFGSTERNPYQDQTQGQTQEGQTQQGQSQQGQMAGQGGSTQHQGESQLQADAVRYLLEEARSAVQNNNMVQAEERLNRLDQMVRDDREKLQQAIDDAAEAVDAGDPDAVKNALDQAKSALQGQQG